MRHSRELAELLLRKAEQDEFALDKLIPDPDSPDEIIGSMPGRQSKKC